MALKILANTVWRDAVEIRKSNISNIAKIENITSGARRLFFNNENKSTSADDPEIQYIDLSGDLTADTLVLVNANNHNTHLVRVRSYSIFPGTLIPEFVSSDFSETLIGKNSTDWVLEFTERTNQQAFAIYFDAGVGGDYVPNIHQVYFCKALELNYVESGVSTKPIDENIAISRTYYRCDEELSLQLVNITQDQIDEFENLYKIHEEPFFIYDDLGTILPDQLWHVIAPEKSVIQRYKNYNVMNLTAYRLKEY